MYVRQKFCSVRFYSVCVCVSIFRENLTWHSMCVIVGTFQCDDLSMLMFFIHLLAPLVYPQTQRVKSWSCDVSCCRVDCDLDVEGGTLRVA